MGINVDKLWSIEAEAAVLGSMLYDPDCIGNIIAILDEKAFYLPEHQTIFNCLATLFITDVPVDAISLRTELKSLNQLENIGGVEYIGKILDSVCSAANANYYASIVRDRKRYRDLIEIIEKIKEVPSEPLKVDEQIQQVQELALSLEQGKPEKEYFTFASDAERIAAESQEQGNYIPTGLQNIDRVIGGVCPGDLVIPAGRPSMGKSALALQIAMNMAKSGLAIIFFTLEMTAKSLIQRALRQYDQTELGKLNITIHERADTPEKQLAFIRTLKQRQQVNVVFVDYLQLMTSGNKSENRVQEITTISRKLKLAAVKENIPIFALSQLNRQVDNRDKHRPKLCDLRESGSIENDADIVMLINREDYYRRSENPDSPMDGKAEIIIAKNRRGKTGIAELIFIDDKVTFFDKTVLNFKE